MRITSDMDLGQLAERMGQDATVEMAWRMRQALMNAGHDGEGTRDVDEIDWNHMLEAASQ